MVGRHTVLLGMYVGPSAALQVNVLRDDGLAFVFPVIRWRCTGGLSFTAAPPDSPFAFCASFGFPGTVPRYTLIGGVPAYCIARDVCRAVGRFAG